MAYKTSYNKKRNFRPRRRYRRRAKSTLVSTIKAVSKAVTLKEAETKRMYITNSNVQLLGDLGSAYLHDVLSHIPQAAAGEASWENRRIGNSVQPCWLKGWLFIRNVHHGTFDYAKNYSVRIMFLKDRNNIINDPSIPASAFPLYRKEGTTQVVQGNMYDNIRDVDYRAWKVMSDKHYKLYQYSTFTAGALTDFIKIPVSLDLTKCTFDFDRGDAQLSKENIVMLIQSRSFNGNVVANQTVSVDYEFTLSFKDV